jgi:hypothetical protein
VPGLIRQLTLTGPSTVDTYAALCIPCVGTAKSESGVLALQFPFQNTVLAVGSCCPMESEARSSLQGCDSISGSYNAPSQQEEDHASSDIDQEVS